MFNRIGRVLASAALLATCAMGTAQAEEKVINFGIMSTESSQNLKTIWQPFLDDMSKKTGLKVNATFASDYAGLIQGMRFNKVDVAWLGNKAAMEAVDRSNGEIFAQTSAANGAAGYWSLLIVRKDSPINSVEDMLKNAKTLTFGNGDPNSTSGYLVPGYYVFAKNHVDASTAFKRTLNSSHEVNALSVAKGQLDVATFNTESWDRLAVTQPDKVEQLKVIWKSPLIPADPMVWSKALSDENKAKIREFFASYGDTDEEKTVLKNMQLGKFLKSSDDQLLPIRQLELFKQRTEVAASTTLDAKEKETRLKEIDAGLSKLQERITELNQKTASSTAG
ncbi:MULTISPECIES: phosphonate ABC transporter substrate-binding protein [Pseudomonas]|jgi:phosphonate ABC transporter, periplasmic phosphonate binding protein|uniref:Phosphonate ABC transporter substrate-binding protein n=6 Tax=Pseudomonas syringae group TaxID=136849 RepID=A0ABU7NFK3_PSEVI|nr:MULTISPECIES: phosphonate ABC transporter substrate-binding protein [Pseudomonas]MBD8571390.1 phosphonate ABC transporter substrate-binding protein [Pseudomonas syringae]EKN43523.1 phosphonates ABC transporter periplasmic phosphonates-binding protein [Pseudomonas viridiflava UASWS0038]KPL64910.1 alkylphosphonate ABC transporter substrate-binding protein [Pseudomonas viridiflava]KPY43111.1 Phosphonates ABC transporter periplasmic phosphonates-binding protein [Pseudomonas syringae pv. ribicola